MSGQGEWEGMKKPNQGIIELKERTGKEPGILLTLETIFILTF